jgi:hypothetical protein
MKKFILLIFYVMCVFGCKGEAMNKSIDRKPEPKFSYYLFAYLPELSFLAAQPNEVVQHPSYRFEDHLEASVQLFNSYPFYKDGLTQDQVLFKQGIINEKYSMYDKRYNMMRYPDQYTNFRKDFTKKAGMHNYEQYFIGRGKDNEVVIISCGLLAGELDGPEVKDLFKICQATNIDIKTGYSVFYKFHYKHLNKWKKIHEGIKKKSQTLGWDELPSLNLEKYGSK